MRKELVISSIPQETRVAVLEDGELVEFLIERRRSQGIAGNIYKGRVTKVLPGMQSAFVDIGLERDAFLYVSDFLEDMDEYERMASTAEDEALKDGGPGRGDRRARGGDREKSGGRERRGRERDRFPAPDEDNGEPGKSSDAPSRSGPDPEDAPRSRDARTPDRDGRSPSLEGEKRSARRGERDERMEHRPKAPSFEPDAGPRPTSVPSPAPGPLAVLPGESLKKYRGRSHPGAAASEARQADTASDDGAEAASESEAPATPAATADAGDSDREPESTPAGTADAPPAGAGRETPRGEDERTPESSDSEGDDDGGSTNGEVRRARIIDRGSDGAFTRKAPSRRPRRRSSGKSDDNRSSAPDGGPTISDLLKEGQEILVQVSKEPLGKKGARITSHIALPGRYLVYMPTVNHVGVSRKIASDDERSRLRRIIAENRGDLPGGFIVRTAAEGRDEKEFVQDLRFLFELWKEIREKSEKTSAPAVIHADLGLVERVLRDQLSDEYKAIRLDSEVEYTKVLDFVSKFQPSLVHRVRLHLKNTPIFEEYGLQQEIDKALRSKVWLKSGGYIVVNQTEALVAIDVNTGKFVGKSNRLEDTIVKTNIDAVHEIVRQIRLRNLGGIIVVDFIDMEERKNRQRVMQALEEELEKDRSPSKILQFNDFGLVAITRKRTQASLERVLGTPCPRCSGSGYVKAVETVCYEIQQELKKMLDGIESGEVTVRVSPEVAKALKSAEFVDLTELEEESRTDIRIQSDPMLPAERFDVYE